MNFRQIFSLTVLFYVLSCLTTLSPTTDKEQKVYADTKKEFNVKDMDKRVIDRHMGRLDTYIKWLDVSIKAKDWDKITLYTKNLDSLCELLLSRNIDISNVPQDFLEMDMKLQETRDYILEASAERDVKALREEYKRLRNTCKHCHKKYKEDEKKGK